MKWNRAQAIYIRDTAVAAVGSAKECALFQQRRLAAQEPTLEQQFEELKLALEEAGLDGLTTVPRMSRERPNAFVQTLAQEAKSAISMDEITY